MDTFIKLMDNKLVAFIFGIVMALIGYLGAYGSTGAILFAGAFALVCIAFKELINNQMCDNPFRYWVPLWGIIGSVAVLLLLFLL